MRVALAVGLTALVCIPAAAAAGFVLNHPANPTRTVTKTVQVRQVVRRTTPGLTVAHLFDGIPAAQIGRVKANGHTWLCGNYVGTDWQNTLCIQEDAGT